MTNESSNGSPSSSLSGSGVDWPLAGSGVDWPLAGRGVEAPLAVTPSAVAPSVVTPRSRSRVSRVSRVGCAAGEGDGDVIVALLTDGRVIVDLVPVLVLVGR